MHRVMLLGWAFVGIGVAPLWADDTQIAADEQTLKAAHLKSDGEALLHFFRGRTVSDEERAKVQELIRQLGAASFRQREDAVMALINRGPVALEMLKQAVKDADLEIARRAEKTLQRIQAGDVPIEVPAAAARLLAIRKPADAVKVLLAYLPFADNDHVADEVRNTMTALAVRDGKPEPILVAALTDKDPLRRATAGEILCRGGSADLKPGLRKLLHDAQPLVRLRLALAFVAAKDKDAVQVLIDLLPDLTLAQLWQAEDLLYRLAEDKNPPVLSLSHDEAGRKKLRDTWTAWWKEHGDKIDLARLGETPPMLNYTIVVMLDLGRVMELGNDNHQRWKIDDLVFPLDVQFLPGDKLNVDRLLVAEYHAGRVTERNVRTGEITWEKRIAGPLVAQRLPNGNTFIATDSHFLEVDRAGQEKLNLPAPAGEKVMKAMKMPNGEIACLTSEARIVRLDGAGKELHRFSVQLSTRLFGGRIHVLPNGRVLIPHNGENKVVEYDANGKAVWEVTIEQPIAAIRLPNGNTLVTSMSPQRGAVEFDRHGNVKWSFRADTRVTRALRR